MAQEGSVYGKHWSETEYILTLDTYLKYRSKPLHNKSPQTLRLARLIGRTPDSIAMRFENYASIDPNQSHRKALSNIGPAGQRVVNEWLDDPGGLSKCAVVLFRQLRDNDEESLFTQKTEPKIIFNKYILEDLWRDGGFARIYTCRKISDGEIFALKVFQTERMTNGAFDSLQRFRREIRLLRSIEHPSVIRIYEDSLDSEPVEPAYVMDFAKHSLTEYIEQVALTGPGEATKRPALDPISAANIFNTVCEGVQALHSNASQVIHRDINPNNVLYIQEIGWVLSDFGLAKYFGPAPAVTTFATVTGPGIGTAHYTAPEQWKDLGAAHIAADIYSLGVLLWELHTSDVGFYRDRLKNPDWLDPVVRRAIAMDPEDRHPDVPSLQTEFNEARADC